MNNKKLIQQCLFLGICIASPMSFAAAPHFHYDDQHWGDLRDTAAPTTSATSFPYAVCGIGGKQSPVDIDLEHNVNLGINVPAMSYLPVSLSLTNNGHTIRINMPPAATNPNYLLVGKEKYELLQLHFHAKSEHVRNNIAYPLEVHFVHATPSGKLAVVGVLFEEGAENAEFAKVLHHMSAVVGTTVDAVSHPELVGVNIDPNKFKPRGKDFDGYAGSLTTPPCTEGVEWFVMRSTITASPLQIQEFEHLYMSHPVATPTDPHPVPVFVGNARLPQNLNGRHPQTLTP